MEFPLLTESRTGVTTRAEEDRSRAGEAAAPSAGAKGGAEVSGDVTPLRHQLQAPLPVPLRADSTLVASAEAVALPNEGRPVRRIGEVANRRRSSRCGLHQPCGDMESSEGQGSVVHKESSGVEVVIRLGPTSESVCSVGADAVSGKKVSALDEVP